MRQQVEDPELVDIIRNVYLKRVEIIEHNYQLLAQEFWRLIVYE